MIKLLLNFAGMLVKPFSKVWSSKIQAKAKAQSDMIDYETELAKQMKHSWKDEYLTIVFTCFIPVLLLGALFSAFEITADIGTRLTVAGGNMADILKNVFEGNFHYIITLIVSASFGIHVTRSMKANKLGGVVKEITEKKKTAKKSFWGDDMDRDRK